MLTVAVNEGQDSLEFLLWSGRGGAVALSQLKQGSAVMRVKLQLLKTASENRLLPPFSSCCFGVSTWLLATDLWRSSSSMYQLSFKDMSFCCLVDVLEQLSIDFKFLWPASAMTLKGSTFFFSERWDHCPTYRMVGVLCWHSGGLAHGSHKWTAGIFFPSGCFLN